MFSTLVHDELLVSGYTATAASSGSSSDPGNVDEEVLMWKFDHLDKNKDSLLERNETTILKRLVKQQIQPRQCAKTFISFCANGDKKISKREWLDCLKIGSMENRKLLSDISSSSSFPSDESPYCFRYSELPQRN